MVSWTMRNNSRRARFRLPGDKESAMPATSPDSLDRFLDAQKDSYDIALSELTRGRKQSHWMWFIFPQLRGLGHSAMSHHYGIADADEAGRKASQRAIGILEKLELKAVDDPRYVHAVIFRLQERLVSFIVRRVLAECASELELLGRDVSRLAGAAAGTVVEGLATEAVSPTAG